MSTYESLFADALQLPIAERIRLIEALWDTVPDESLPPLSEEWLAEIQRRSAEYDAGNVETVPWETIRADAMERLKQAPRHAAD